MKNYKWLWVTLTILFTFVVLAGVALASFHLGVLQSGRFVQNEDDNSAPFPPFGFMPGNREHINPEFKGNRQMMQGFGMDRPDHRGFGHGRGDGFLLRPLVGLLQLGVLVLLIWGGYTLYRRTGWHFVKVAPDSELAKVKPAGKKKK